MNPNLEALMNQIPRSYLTAEERLRNNIQRVILDGEERTLTTEELAEIEKVVRDTYPLVEPKPHTTYLGSPMITLTPIKPKEVIIQAMQEAFDKLAVKPDELPSKLINGKHKSIADILFKECGLIVEVRDEHFRIKNISRTAFDKLYDAYLHSAFGMALDSIVFADRARGGITQPFPIHQATAANMNIVMKCNSYWQENKITTSDGAGEILYEVFQLYDDNVSNAIQYRLESESIPTKPKSKLRQVIDIFKK